MDALQMRFHPKAQNKYKKAIVVDEDLCIGCGVCVHKCKTKSITLVRRPDEEITLPPKTAKEMVSLNVMAVMKAKDSIE